MTAIGIPHGRRAVGRVRVPPSKSATNRALNLALLAGSALTLERPLLADDTEVFLGALGRLGYVVERMGDDVRVEPAAPPAAAEIDCGASGTMARFLTGALSTLPGSWRLDGTSRLRERPVGPLVRALRSLGARIECLGQEGYLPLAIEGRPLAGGAVTVDAADSSQYLSSLLMASSRAAGPVAIEIAGLASGPYVELTLEAMRAFGVEVERSGPSRWMVVPGLLAPGVHPIEGDFSAACYFAAAAALTGGRMELLGVRPTSMQGDRLFLALLGEMGAEVEWLGPDRALVSGSGRLDAVDVDLAELPDQVPTLAAIAPFAAGRTRIRNVAHLRIKESDRLAACAAELGRVGAAVESAPDGLTIPGVWAIESPPEEPVTIKTHDDHRIAMSFALLGLRRPHIQIAEPGVVSKSYPGFWEDLERCLVV